LNNPFGHSYDICDRLWFQKDLKSFREKHYDLVQKITNLLDVSLAETCATCYRAIDKGNIPVMSTYNGFVFPEKPKHLPELDPVSERLISPRIPL